MQKLQLELVIAPGVQLWYSYSQKNNGLQRAGNLNSINNGWLKLISLWKELLGDLASYEQIDTDVLFFLMQNLL